MSSSNSQIRFKHIFKNSGQYGIVQIFLMIISMTRTKVISVFIGSAGIGYFGLINSAISLVTSLVSLGISNSSVKEIAQSQGSKTFEEIQMTSQLVQKLSILTAFFGFIVTIVVAPFIFKELFYSNIILQSIAFAGIIFFTQLSNGNIAILQGLGSVLRVSKVNIIGNIIGIVISLPLFIFFRKDGIMISLLITWCFIYIISNIEISKEKLSLENFKFSGVLKQGKDLISLGIIMAIGGIVTSLSSYLVQIFINKTSGIQVVGFYSASIGLTTMYFSLLFTSMANDYFPRLSAIVNDNELVEDTIHNQIILILTIIGPMIATMTISCGFIIKLLYSDDFQGINNIVLWMTFSYIFKAISWTIGFLIIAKGLGKHFLWNELISNSYMLLIQIISFKYFYLDGLAKGYLIGTVLHLIQILLYSRYYLNIKIKVEVFIVAFLFLVLNILLVYSLQHYLNKEISVITASIVFVSIFAFSFIKLRDYFTHR